MFHRKTFAIQTFKVVNLVNVYSFTVNGRTKMIYSCHVDVCEFHVHSYAHVIYKKFEYARVHLSVTLLSHSLHISLTR